MASKKAVELLKEIVKFAQKSTGFESVLKHVRIFFKPSDERNIRL